MTPNMVALSTLETPKSNMVALSTHETLNDKSYIKIPKSQNLYQREFDFTFHHQIHKHTLPNCIIQQ